MKFKRITALLLLCLFPISSWALTLDEESKYGRESYLEIARSSRLCTDPYACIEMAIIKRRLEAVSDLPFQIKLTVIDTDALDAFATVGGYVYVTTGILEKADRESEIAGVLAHEFTHVGKRHVARELEKEKYINWAMVTTMLLALLAPSPAAKAALMTGGMGAGQTMALKYSREAEEEADRGGVEKVQKAGYSALGMADFLKKLSNEGLEKTVPQYLLTHPYSEDRVMKIQEIAKPMKTRVDVSLFPFVVARLQILGKPLGAQNEDIWLKKHRKDPKDPVATYGAALVYMLKGDIDRSIELAKTIDSPNRPLFLGEFYIAGRRFKDAVSVLQKETHPVARFLLAKAYEGEGDLANAAGVLKGMVPYAGTFPEIDQRLGMVLGRQGDEAGGYEYLGRYYFGMGRYQPAKINLEKAIAKYGINSREAEPLLRILDIIKPPKEKKKEG